MRRATLPYIRKSSLTKNKRSASVATLQAETAAPAPPPPPPAVFWPSKLPLELQGEILVHLEHQDVIQFRLVSKSCLQFLERNESVIVRHLWRQRFRYGDLPCLCACKRDFVSASAMPAAPTFDDYFYFMYRDAVTAKLAESLAAFVQSKVQYMLMRTHTKFTVTMRWNLIGRLHLALAHLRDYWLAYRRLVEESLDSAVIVDNRAIQRKLLEQFSIPCLLECYGAFDLLFLLLCTKLRPKTYAGSIERLVRRWNADAAPVPEIVMVFVYGGYEMINHLVSIKPYARRRAALSSYIKHLHNVPVSTSLRALWSRKSSDPKAVEDGSSSDPLPAILAAIERQPAQTKGTVRDDVLRYAAEIHSPELFDQWERILLDARIDTERPLAGGFEFGYVAMRKPPAELNFAKIQDDWTKHYPPRDWR